mgnify:CR=1 FL=1
MNKEIINTIENDKNILTNILLENNIKNLNKNIEKNDAKEKFENKDNKIEDKDKEQIIPEDKKDIIQSESRIMNNENLIDPNNQSSIMYHSAILAKDYILILKEPDAPFSIEYVLKFEKKEILGILDFLTLKEKINLTGMI